MKASLIAKSLIISFLLGTALTPQPAQGAAYASGSLAFNASGSGCPTTSPEGGYLSIAPGVSTTGGDTFTVQAVIRSSSINNQNAVVLIGAQTANGALSIRNLSNSAWSIDLSGDSRLRFVMPSGVMANNTWYQLTVVGDSSGIGFWIDGVRLRSDVADLDWSYTSIGAPGQTGKLKQISATPDIFKFHTPISAASQAVGAWTNNGWCAGGFDLSNLRFNTNGLFASSATSVTFPSTPLGNVAGTTLLINNTTSSETTTTTDVSGIQTITNRQLLVTATVDTNTPIISITTPASQTVAPGQAVSCTVGSTGGAISQYEVSPAVSNGLTFDSSTGLLTGIPTAIASSVTYVITGYNNSGAVSTSCTITVNAPPAAISISAPLQKSQFDETRTTCTISDLQRRIEFFGNFIEEITNITVNGIYLPINSWIKTSLALKFNLPGIAEEKLSIQIYNGSAPVLKDQEVLCQEIAAVPVATPTAESTPTPVVTPTPTPTPIPTTNVQPAKSMRKIAVFGFTLNSYSLSASARKEITKLAKKLNTSSDHTVFIYGNTDSQGGVDNVKLSKQRAFAVRTYLGPLLKEKKIQIGWFAATRPAVKGKSEAAYAANRRVEIWVK
jgi:outer membrane protein OmpA-like peptidoglycan-associated protein